MVPKVDRVVSLHSLAPILAGLAVVVSPTVAFAASFTSLGDLPGGAAESFAFGVPIGIITFTNALKFRMAKPAKP